MVDRKVVVVCKVGTLSEREDGGGWELKGEVEIPAKLAGAFESEFVKLEYLLLLHFHPRPLADAVPPSGSSKPRGASRPPLLIAKVRLYISTNPTVAATSTRVESRADRARRERLPTTRTGDARADEGEGLPGYRIDG